MNGSVQKAPSRLGWGYLETMEVSMVGGQCYLPSPSLQGCQFRYQAKEVLSGAESLKEGNDGRADGHGWDCCVVE